MSSVLSFGHTSKSTPEYGNNLSSKDAELLQAYYETVEDSFKLVHEASYAMGMNMNPITQSQPAVEQQRPRFNVVAQTAAADDLETARRSVEASYNESSQKDIPYAPAA